MPSAAGVTAFARQAAFVVDRLRPLLLAVPRILIGYLVLLHGLDKFNMGLDNVEAFFEASGVPLAGVAARAEAYLEVIGGVALIVGLATRVCAVLLTCNLLGAVYFVTAEFGVLNGAELELAYIAALFTLVVAGPGRLSLDHWLRLEPLESTNLRAR